MNFASKTALNLKILDPSVGDGQFLITALTLLEEFLGNIRDRGFLKRKIPGIRLHLITNCLYGVDIDEEAVKKCRERIQEDMLFVDLNIKHGNALYGFDWKTEFPEVFEQGGFDIIIGNPPYIRQEKLKDLKPKLSELYETYMGTADIYVYFIELSIQLLRSNGYFSNIISNKFLRTNYGRKVRKYILENTRIVLFKDQFEKRVFEDISVDPCIIVLTKVNNNQDNKIRVNDSFYSPQSHLSEESWSFINQDFIEIKEQLERNSILLKDYCGQPLSGIKTGFNKALIVTKEKMEEIIGENEHEKELFVPFIKGKDIKKWKLEFQDNYLIFTENKDINNYPNVLNHFNQYKAELENRVDIIETQKKWYELRPCTYYDEFQKPKIIYPDISHGANFTLDLDGYFADMTAFIIPKNDKYLLGILNSKLFEFYFNLIGVKLGEMGWRLKTIYMNIIPIKNVDDEIKKKFNKIVDIIMYLNQNSIDDNIKEISNFYEDVLLNIMVFELYFSEILKERYQYLDIISKIDSKINDLNMIIDNKKNALKKIYQEFKKDSEILKDIKQIQDHEWFKAILLS